MARSNTGPLSGDLFTLAGRFVILIPSRTIILVEPGARQLQPLSSTDDSGTLSPDGAVECDALRNGPLARYLKGARIVVHAENARAQRTAILIAREDAHFLPLKELHAFREHTGKLGAADKVKGDLFFDLKTYTAQALNALIRTIKPADIQARLRSPIEERPDVAPALVIVTQSAPESDDPPMLSLALASALGIDVKNVRQHLDSAEALLLAPGRADFFCRFDAIKR